MKTRTILTIILTACILSLNNAGGAGQDGVFPAFPYTKMTLEEKFKFWQGKKVILLTDAPKEEELIFKMFENSKYGRDPRISILRRYKKSEKFGGTKTFVWNEFVKPYVEDALPYREYAGKTGTVIDAQFQALSAYKFIELLISLDGSGEKAVLIDRGYVGFFDEMEIAKTYIGRSLWSLEDGSYTSRGRAPYKKFEKVTVTRADWRTASTSIALYFKTGDGKEFTYGFGYIDNRFHHEVHPYETPYIDFNESYTSFATEDPIKRHPEWPPQVWEVIKNGEVAIGMTEEMVKLACRPLRKGEAIVAVNAPEQSGWIYDGCGRSFLIGANGKVTKYIERR